jgi:hypothetical protein
MGAGASAGFDSRTAFRHYVLRVVSALEYFSLHVHPGGHLKVSSRIPLFALGVLACNSAATSGPGTLGYSAVANVVNQVPTKVELHGTIRNDGSQSFTIHSGACSVGYRLYSYSLVQGSTSPAYEFNPTGQLCIAIAYQKTLAPGQEYAMNSGPLTLSGLIAPGVYELRVTMYHDGVVGEASAGQINIQ